MPLLSGFALRVQPLAARDAAAARDVERDHDPLARANGGHVTADLLDNPHWLVTENVTLLRKRAQNLTKMKVGTAEPGRGDPYDHIRRAPNLGVGNLIHADVAPAMACHCPHLVPPWALCGGGYPLRRRGTRAYLRRGGGTPRHA